MNPLRPIVTALFTLLFIATAGAQIGVYAGVSGTHLNTPSSTATIYGPLFGFYAQKGRPLSLGADVRASFFNHNGIQFDTGAAGPRIAFKPEVLPIKPYVEALVGVASYNGGSSSNSIYLNYQLIGGIDATILPRLDWRVIEFDSSALAGSSADTRTLTTGIVVRLP